MVGSEATRRPGPPLLVKETIDERNYASAPANTCSLEAPVSGEGWDGVPHICRVRHLHDFRCRLSFLYRKKSLRTDSTGSAGNAHLLHNLSAVQQFDRSLCGKASGTRQARRIPALMGAHDRSRRPLFVWHRPGIAPFYLRTRSDHLHEPFWNNVLLVGWPARLSRYRWINHAEHRAVLRTASARRARAVSSGRHALSVLAFRGCRVGCS